MTLATADGALRECSRTNDARLFRATLGGMGLTGVILSASFRLKPIETAFLLTETVPARDLDEAMALFEASREWPYSVAWIDCLARGPALGRALLMRGRFPGAGRSSAGPRRRSPGPAARTGAHRSRRCAGDAAQSRLGRSRQRAVLPARAGARRVPAHALRAVFSFPWIASRTGNRLYGRQGFVQYQCVLPLAESATGMAALLERVAAAGQGSFLAVLKLFGAVGEGLMSFPMAGYTLALDFPMRSGTLAFLDTLDQITHAHGGTRLSRQGCVLHAGPGPRRLSRTRRFRRGAYGRAGRPGAVRLAALPAARSISERAGTGRGNTA